MLRAIDEGFWRLFFVVVAEAAAAAGAVTSVNMHLKNLDFDMQDTAFDCDIDVEFDASVMYRKHRLHGIATNYFVLQ